MPNDLLPASADPDTQRPTDPQGVAEAFMAALAEPDLDLALSLLAEDVVYSNVGLPTIRGRERVARVLGGLAGPNSSFEVYLHAIACDGPVVLTERTDVIVVGPLRTQFWVWGRFDVHDGVITLWRDSFDFLDITKGLLRGLGGIALPALRPAPPAIGDAPGR